MATAIGFEPAITASLAMTKENSTSFRTMPTKPSKRVWDLEWVDQAVPAVVEDLVALASAVQAVVDPDLVVLVEVVLVEVVDAVVLKAKGVPMHEPIKGHRPMALGRTMAVLVKDARVEKDRMGQAVPVVGQAVGSAVVVAPVVVDWNSILSWDSMTTASRCVASCSPFPS
jgi:hypothetical protein